MLKIVFSHRYNFSNNSYSNYYAIVPASYLNYTNLSSIRLSWPEYLLFWYRQPILPKDVINVDILRRWGPKTQSEFVYCSCCHGDHADKKAAINIAELGCSRSAYGPVVLDLSKAMKYPRIKSEDMLTKL